MQNADTFERTKTISSIFGDEVGKYCLRMVFSPDDLVCGTEFPLDGRSIVFGRSRGNRRKDAVRAGRIEAADPRMSAEHAAVGLGPSPGAVIVEDLGSKNGTWVDGRSVQRSLLPRGGVLRVGNTIAVLCPEASPRTAHSRVLRGLVGVSEAIVSLRQTIKRLAPEELSVLICGESGTGKELVAQALHDCSGRSGRYVALNTAAVPDSLFESELFGVRKGAFSGADVDRDGYVVEADKGTLFLDEIGDMPPKTQTKLLRTLEESEVTAVGATRPRKVNVRFVAATNADIDAHTSHGDFRLDLLHRLAHFRLTIPPLKERKEDIPVFWNHFLACQDRKHEAEASLLEALMLYPWPGNVRELRNAAAYYLVQAEDRKEGLVNSLPANIVSHYKRTRNTGSATLPEEAVQPQGRMVPAVQALSRSNDVVPSNSLLPAGRRPTRDVLLEALRDCEGNLAEVGRRFGRHRPQVYRWLKWYDIDRRDLK